MDTNRTDLETHFRRSNIDLEQAAKGLWRTRENLDKTAWFIIEITSPSFFCGALCACADITQPPVALPTPVQQWRLRKNYDDTTVLYFFFLNHLCRNKILQRRSVGKVRKKKVFFQEIILGNDLAKRWWSRVLSGAMEIESLQMFFLRRKGIYIYIYINIYLTRLMTAPHTHTSTVGKPSMAPGSLMAHTEHTHWTLRHSFSLLWKFFFTFWLPVYVSVNISYASIPDWERGGTFSLYGRPLRHYRPNFLPSSSSSSCRDWDVGASRLPQRHDIQYTN